MSNPKKTSIPGPSTSESVRAVPLCSTEAGPRNGLLKVKDTFYFSHDYNTRNDEKIKRLIRKHGMSGYGIFWAIIEDLYNNANALQSDYDGIAYDLHTDPETVQSIINDFDLFAIQNGTFGSISIERRLSDRNEKSKKARESAFKRWSIQQPDANAMRTQCERNAIKERKGKERKDSIIYRFSKFYDEEIEKSKGQPLHDNYVLAVQMFHGEIGITGRMEKILSIKGGLTYPQFEALYKLAAQYNVKLSDYFAKFDNYTGKYNPKTVYTSIHTWMDNDFKKAK